ncbi:RIKEN cDNA D930001I22, isoform CRA_b, partial [Mus musculus]
QARPRACRDTGTLGKQVTFAPSILLNWPGPGQSVSSCLSLPLPTTT